ncbi:MAG TPA: ATP-binding cassette domain-containing protein [candidate division Zixibacteria bacterium]|nr:ATP-binding cassette domain-containing protein [candidate division Zixibacteria bacterium]
MSYLVLENINKSFGAKVAVRNLSLEVPRGSIYGVIGPNGAGKTTTIRMIMNITVPDSGRVLIEGRERPADFKNIVGYLPEERGLYKKMTVLEIITYMAALKGFPETRSRKEAVPWLERMNLLEYKDHKVEELSKGMQQKLQFITTILHDPELIILDELFSGLDPLNIELIKSVILDLKARGKTILFSTHVMEQAEKLCDHVCMINRGSKVLDGRMSEVKAAHGTNTIELVVDGDASFVNQLPGVSRLVTYPNYLELQLADGADSNAILQAVASKVSVRRFSIEEPSLYNIFIEVAGVDPDQLASGTGGGAHA